MSTGRSVETVPAGQTGFSVGVVQLMTATAEEVPGADLNDGNRMAETVAYEPESSSGSGPVDPMGSSDMPKANPTPQAHGRYTFGSGARPLDGYTIKRAIGRGGFGEVYYATSDSGKEVALKLILRNLDVETARSHAVHEPEVPEPAHDLRSEDQRFGRHVRRHGVRRRSEPGQRLEAISSGAARWPRCATGSKDWSKGSPICTTTGSSTAI